MQIETMIAGLRVAFYEWPGQRFPGWCVYAPDPHKQIGHVKRAARRPWLWRYFGSEDGSRPDVTGDAATLRAAVEAIAAAHKTAEEPTP